MNEEYKKLGSCIFSHRVLMVFRLKGCDVKTKFVSLRTGEDSEKTFKKLGSCTSKIPVLVHYSEDENKNIIIEEAQAIIDYIMEKFPDAEGQPESALQPTNQDTNLVGISLLAKLSAFIREPDGSEKHKQALEVELTKLNKFLSENPHRFLDGPTLKLPDCSLLPKLHQVIVACESVKGYKIPNDKFGKVLEYFEEAKKEDAFISTAPADKEIESSWKAKRR